MRASASMIGAFGVISHPSRILGDGCTRICALRAPGGRFSAMHSSILRGHRCALLSFSRSVRSYDPGRVVRTATALGQGWLEDPNGVGSMAGDPRRRVCVVYLLSVTVCHRDPLTFRGHRIALANHTQSVFRTGLSFMGHGCFRAVVTRMA